MSDGDPEPARAPVHVPVMLDEVLHWLAPAPGKIYLDGTLGGGGHTRALAERVGDGSVIALDRDPAALAAAEGNLAGLPIKLVNANFCETPEVLEQLGMTAVDGIVLDLGLSSDQLADRQRGFSFDADGPLDLRFNPLEGEPAWRLIERLSEKHLADLIFHYGEERFSRRIARKIVEQRRTAPIRTAGQLAALVRSCVPRSAHERIDPATRTFQGLRIAVNDELKSLEIALKRLPDCLRPGGRLAIISFHSLEDRRVKKAFREDARFEVLTKKPLRPSPAEQIRNPRSRSAKMRVAARRATE
jgi:16S rRNA (cytosine1402-N4)-methyltransferase